MIPIPVLVRLLVTVLSLLSLLQFTHGQERPFTDLKKFDDSQNLTFRTNICDRQRQLFDGDIELPDALSGLNLTVAMTNYPFPNENRFFTLVDGKIKEKDPGTSVCERSLLWLLLDAIVVQHTCRCSRTSFCFTTGLFVVIMDELAARAGFSWRNTFAAIDPIDPAVDGDKTWTDMLVWEVAHFDIAADYWGRSEERMAKGVSFPTGWYDGSIILATSITPESDDFDLWGYFTPFAGPVWFAILGLIFFTGLAYFLLERLNHASDEAQLEEKPLVAIFVAALAFTGHYEFKPRTHAARMLGFSWTFWALIMASAYTANLASFLVSRNDIQFSVSTLDDALVTGTPVCIQKGAVMDDIITKDYPELTVVRKETEQEMFEALTKPWYGGAGGCGVLITNLGTYQVYQGQTATNADCTLTSEKRVILTLPSGFATAVDSGTLCTSLVSHVMDLYMTEMIADGFIEQAWQDHLDKISQIDCVEPVPNSGDDDIYSLGLKEMGGIFVTHLLLTTVAVVVAIVQYKHAKATKPKEELRPVLQSVRSGLKAMSSRKNTQGSELCEISDSTSDNNSEVRQHSATSTELHTGRLLGEPADDGDDDEEDSVET